MELPRRQFLHLAAGAVALPAMSRFAWAQTYPSRPITIVMPFAAGSAFDTLARILGERMRGSLGQPVIIENVTGAGGSIGVGRVARAAADGYTLSMGGSNTHVVNGAIYTLQYDVLSDFEPISLLTTLPLLIVTNKAVPATTLKELIAWLKSNPDKASAGTAGAGTPQHVAGVYFQNMTGTRFQFVPYRGGGPAMQDLLAGQIDLIFDLADGSLPQVRGGTIKAYAVTGKSRLAVAPEIPTVDEAGLPGFHVSVWRALWAPKGTPKNVIGKLNAAVVDALADLAVRSRITDLGQEIPPRNEQTPEGLGAFHKAEVEKWWPIIKAANIKGE
jgi:tripartite-type tricarboxylate transporter receptor subunit TctC